jgi:hypothetical protein
VIARRLFDVFDERTRAGLYTTGMHDDDAVSLHTVPVRRHHSSLVYFWLHTSGLREDTAGFNQQNSMRTG